MLPGRGFARLRVFQHRVLVIDAVLRFKIVGIGRRPMHLQGRTDFSIVHHMPPFMDYACDCLPGDDLIPARYSRLTILNPF